MKKASKYFEEEISTAKEWALKMIEEKQLKDWTDVFIFAHKLKQMKLVLDEENKTIFDIRIVHLLLIAKEWEEKTKKLSNY